jgi:CspA family cold shock protein
MKGTVKWYNFKKGYGFISGEDGKDYFVHYTMVSKDLMLKDDDSVTFDAVETDKGIQAQNIAIVGSAPAEASATTKAPAEKSVKEQVAPVKEDTKEDSEDF